MVVWHNWLNGHEFGQALGVGDGQGSLVCYSSRGHKESEMPEGLNWTELPTPNIHTRYELSGMPLVSLTFHQIAAYISLPWTHTSILLFKLTKPYLFKIGGFSNYFCAFIIFMYKCIYNLINTYVCANLLHSCLTLWDPMDCSLSCSSVHGILQTRMLEWVTMLSSRGSSQPRDQTLSLLHWQAGSTLPRWCWW